MANKPRVPNLQDRTGADEASVPLDDVMAVKDAHDQLQQAVSLAFEEAVAAIDAGAVSAAVRSQLPNGQATRERFVGVLLPGLIAVWNPRRLLDRTRAALALAPWHPPTPGGPTVLQEAAADAVVEVASVSAVGDEAVSAAASRASQQTHRKGAPAPSLPKPASTPKSAEHGARNYARPLKTNSMSASGRQSASGVQPGSAAKRSEPPPQPWQR